MGAENHDVFKHNKAFKQLSVQNQMRLKIFLAVVLALAVSMSNALAWGEVSHIGVMPQKMAETSKSQQIAGYDDYFRAGAWCDDWFSLLWIEGNDWRCSHSKEFYNSLYNLAVQSGSKEKQAWAAGFVFSSGTDAVWADWIIQEKMTGNAKESAFKYATDLYAKCDYGAKQPKFISYPDLISKAYKQSCGGNIDEGKIKTALKALEKGTYAEYASLNCRLKYFIPKQTKTAIEKRMSGKLDESVSEGMKRVSALSSISAPKRPVLVNIKKAAA